MILTCPECATRYFVADDKLGSAGRTVKCAGCGHRWLAAPEPDLELFADPELGALAREAEGDRVAAPVDDLAEMSGQELPRMIRQRADNDRRVREAAAVGVVWAGMAAGLAALIALAVVFRGNVVDLWPTSAKAFASVGLPVNRVGLTLEQVSAEPALQDGHAALSVSGVMRNIEDRPVLAPPITVELLSPDGRRVAGKIAAAQDARIPPGETRHFSIVLLDPPANGRTLEVAFVYDADQTRAVRAAVQLRPAADVAAPSSPEAAAGLRGATSGPGQPPVPSSSGEPPSPPAPTPGDHGPAGDGPAAATPLPQSSPYALPAKGSHD